MNKKILVLDSGLGGISTLCEIRKYIPKLNIIYFADDQYLPYGDKTEAELILHLQCVIERFESQISGVVIACNTATGVAVERLRKLFCFPIIGTEPAILPSQKNGERTLVLVTPLESVQRKFLKLAKNKNLLICALPNLAKTIEDGLFSCGSISKLNQSEKVLAEVKYIEALAESQNIKNIVLGCTHYVFLKHAGLIDGFNLFDGNEGVAKRTACFFENVGEGSVEIVFGSNNKKKSQKALELLNELLSNFGFKS